MEPLSEIVRERRGHEEWKLSRIVTALYEGVKRVSIERMSRASFCDCGRQSIDIRIYHGEDTAGESPSKRGDTRRMSVPWPYPLLAMHSQLNANPRETICIIAPERQ